MSWRRGQAYAQDLRDRVLAASGSIHQVALRFRVSESYVARARSRRQRLGEAGPGPQHNHRPRRLAGLETALAAQVAAAPDQTLAQLCHWVATEHRVQVSVTTIWKTLARLGLTLKKSRSMPASSSGQTLRKRAKPGRQGNRTSTSIVSCLSMKPGPARK